MLKLYGISNCDTVKRARQWLGALPLAHEFHDFKKSGVPSQALDAWLLSLGWEALLNRKGTTWRKLAPEVQSSVVDVGTARAVMLHHPSVIRRPVVEWPDGEVTVGFDEAAWRSRAGTGPA